MFDAQLFLLFIDALDRNTLTGLIPSEIGLMTSLTRLFLSESIVEHGTLHLGNVMNVFLLLMLNFSCCLLMI